MSQESPGFSRGECQTSVTITTEDGREWTIDDYAAPIGISCAISVEGERITSCTTYTHFD